MSRHFDIASTSAPSASGARGGKRDSSALCRERAAADLLESAAMINANQRIRLETSAASWTARADVLQRVEESFARRTGGGVIGDEPSYEPAWL